MNCERATDLLQDDLDGRLDASVQASLREHLATCAACAREAEEFAELRRLLKSVPPVTAPEGFADSVLARIHVEGAGGSSAEAPAGRIRAFPRWIAPLVAIAAVLLIAVSVLHEDPSSSTPKSTATADRSVEEMRAAEWAVDAEKKDVAGDVRLLRLDEVEAEAPEAERAEPRARGKLVRDEDLDAKRPERGLASREPLDRLADGREESRDTGDARDKSREPGDPRDASPPGLGPAETPAPRPARKADQPASVQLPEATEGGLGGRRTTGAGASGPEAPGAAAPVPRRVFVAFRQRAAAERFAKLLEQPPAPTAPTAATPTEEAADGEAESFDRVAKDDDLVAETLAKLGAVRSERPRFEAAYELVEREGRMLGAAEGERLLALLTPGAGGGGPVTGGAGEELDLGSGGGAGGGPVTKKKTGDADASKSGAGKQRGNLEGGSKETRKGEETLEDTQDDGPAATPELAKRFARRLEDGGLVEVVILIVPDLPTRAPASETEK